MVFFLRSILLLVAFFSSLAQYSLPPPIYAFTSKEYKSHPQIFCIDYLPKRNTLLLGTSGLLCYRGASFQKVQALKSKPIFSIAHTPEEDTIFVGSLSDLGFLVSNSLGTLVFHSLMDKIPDSLKHFNSIWRTHYINGYAVFNGLTTLFIYAPKEDTIYALLPPKNRFFISYAVNDTTLWIGKQQAGIYQLIMKPPFRLRKLKWSSGIKDVMAVLNVSKGSILVSRLEGLFLHPSNKDTLIPIVHQAKSLAEQYQFYAACKVNDTIIAVGTVFNGIYLINLRSERIYSINRRDGLPDNKVWDIVYTGSFLIAGTDNGVAFIRYPAALHWIEEGKFYQGVIQDLTLFSKELFIATSKGVFSFPLDSFSGDKLQPIEGTEGENIQLAIVGQKGVMVAGMKAILFLQTKGDKYIAEIIDKKHIYSVFYTMPYLIAGGRDGLFAYLQKGKCFEKIAEYNKIPEDVTSVILDTSGLWLVVGLWTNGILVGKLQKEQKRFTFTQMKHLDAKQLKIPQGNVYPFLTSKGILLGTARGLFRLHLSDDTLYAKPLCAFGKTFCDTTKLVFRLKEEKDSTLWIDVVSEDGDVIYKLIPSVSGYMVDSLFSFAVEMGAIRALYPDGEGGVWIGGDFGLAHYSPHRKENFLEKYPCVIEKVSTLLQQSEEEQKDSLLWGGWGKTPKLVLPYALNNITFEWIAPYYYHQDKVEYHYMLEGFDESWSAYTKETRKEYTNLPPGEYTFRVQARNVYGVLSEEAMISFRILPPWYMTWWAYALYGLAGISLVAAVVWLSVLRVQTKRREKAYIVEIERLSLVARETSNVIYICCPNGEILWANEAFKRFTGFDNLTSFKQEQGKTLQEIIQHSEIEQLFRQCLESKTPVRFEWENVRRDGVKRYVQTTLTPVVREEKVVWIAAIDMDITELREAYEKLRAIHEELEVLYQEVQDGISYASYIQYSFLPSERYCKEVLGEHFILYLPRDVVSGDFYWVYKDGDTVLFAACDCTGHGVPGAFMSMVCNDILNQLVIEQGLRSPAEILNEARKRVISVFSRSGEEPRPDGMDCALCLWDKRSNTLTFAGANRPLYLCRSEKINLSIFNGRAKEKEGVIIIQGDKMAVGYEPHVSLEKDLFSEITFQVYSGDMLYICTDGYLDQIGGKQGKRLGIKRFLKLLRYCYRLPLSHQKHLLHKVLLNWRGNYRQIDDVLLMGIRIIN